jgi:alkylation response protein AidB-like acyl-CoA dehydrogenase
VPDPTIEGGGWFLIAAPEDTLTPEALGEDARAVAATVDEFWTREVAPALPALERHDPGVARRLLRRSAALGLTAMQVPEPLGGLGLDLPTVVLATEHLAEDPSYLGWHHGHCGLGTLPLVHFGRPDLQRQFLPRLLSAELVAAYALTEPHGGSDALAARTRADLAADGRTYRLNGQKAWITNGGEADVFTVFAKVGGEHLTAFLVERTAGVRTGAEERKMGLHGTSTTAVFFDNVDVPAHHVVGDIGRGHIVALTVLNDGRLKIGPLAIRGAKRVIAASAAHARTRRAFGSPIASFGAVRDLIAGMAARLFAAESVTWHTVGRIQAWTARRAAPGGGGAAGLASFEEFAIESAIVKVCASEMLGAVADAGVQIHGGEGFHHGSLVERAFRDARVNRIFEGTNEINRLVVVSQLLKRAARERLPLAAGASGPPATARGPADREAALVDRARALTRDCLILTASRYGAAIESEQDLVLRLADMAIAVYVMQAVVARARRLGPASTAVALAAAGVHHGLQQVARAAVALGRHLGHTPGAADLVARALALAAADDTDIIGVRRRIAAAVLAS